MLLNIRLYHWTFKASLDIYNKTNLPIHKIVFVKNRQNQHTKYNLWKLLQLIHIFRTVFTNSFEKCWKNIFVGQKIKKNLKNLIENFKNNYVLNFTSKIKNRGTTITKKRNKHLTSVIKKKIIFKFLFLLYYKDWNLVHYKLKIIKNLTY